MILAEITVTDNTGSTVYPCSIEGFQGPKYYYPFVISMPSLEIGPEGGGGLIQVKLGSLTLTREPNNPLHPFGGKRFQDLVNNPDQYACKILWSENKETLHDAAITLASMEPDKLVFKLTDKTYEKPLKHYSITEKWNYVDEVVSATPVQVVVPGHNFVVGQRIVFAEMTGPGIELNYDKAVNNYFIVGQVIGDETLGLLTPDNEPLPPTGITLGTCVYDNGSTDQIPKNRVGIPAIVPFTHGKVFHKTPVVRRHATEVANPNLATTNPSGHLEVYEDGVLIGTTNPNSPELFAIPPTLDTIYLNSPMAEGALSISGISRNGETLSDLYAYFANELTLGFDDSLL